MSYKIIVRLQVHSCFASMSTRDIWLTKEYTLPFAPFIGLTIATGDDDDGVTITADDEINWDGREFTVYKEDKTLYDYALRFPNSKGPTTTVDELAKQWESKGWLRRD